MKLIKLLLVLVAVVNLSSCNKSEDVKNDSDSVVSNYHQSLTSKLVSPNLWTQVISFNKETEIEEVQLLLGDTERCIYQIHDRSISILLDDSAFCAFQYISQDSQQERNYGVVTASSVKDPKNTDLLRYKAISLMENDNESVELKKLATPLSDLDHEAILLDEALVITSDGNSYPYSTSSAEDSVNVIGPANGIDRVVYAYQQTNGDILQGVLLVSGSESDNAAPTANPSIKNIDVNTVTTVDVSDLISDADADKLQLISVIDYGNLSEIEESAGADITNTKFTFSSDTAGTYDVYYVISDHHGGLATSFVRFNVSNRSGALSDIYVTPVEGGSEFIYSYPENVEQANSYQHNGYNGTYTEAGELGLEGESYPYYNYSHASSICVLRGLKLPTTSEMDVLWTEKGDLFAAAQWPTTMPYIVSDGASGKPVAYDMHDGTVGTPSEDAQGYVTCVGYSYDRMAIQEKFAAKNAQRKLHILPYANDIIVPVDANITEWLVNNPSLASISSGGVLTTFDNDGVVTVTAISDAGIQTTQEITITDNLFTLYNDQDPSFDKGVDAAGINYSSPCTEEDSALFLELTGFKNNGMGTVGTGHQAPVLCTNNAKHIPYSGKGYARTDHYKQGSGDGSLGVGSATSVQAFHKINSSQKNYIISGAINLEEALSASSLADITNFGVSITANLVKTDNTDFNVEYGQIIFICDRDPDNPMNITDISLTKSSPFSSVSEVELNYEPKSYWLYFSIAGVMKPDFLQSNRLASYEFKVYPNEGSITVDSGEYTTILDEIGVFYY
ncbi:Ig-like domain-containing protein [Vibrio parahaemolyticus]|uniref:Ig-like domain-containing protein n=1 Tax=Vibrio parahaemolyticus TaxID=670 RepID=UPI003892B643